MKREVTKKTVFEDEDSLGQCKQTTRFTRQENFIKVDAKITCVEGSPDGALISQRIEEFLGDLHFPKVLDVDPNQTDAFAKGDD